MSIVILISGCIHMCTQHSEMSKWKMWCTTADLKVFTIANHLVNVSYWII